MKVISSGAPIPRSVLRPFSVSMRIDEDALAFKELLNDIRENGVEDDLIVRPAEESGYFEIIDGHRRYKATGVLEYGDRALPCEIREMTDEEAWTLAIRLNVLRAQPSAASLGNFITLMRMKFGWTQQQVAKRIGKSQSWVSRHEQLFSDQAIPTGTNEAQARAFRSVPESVREELIQEIGEGPLPTAKEIRERAKKRITDIADRLDYSRHDKEYATFLFEEEGGFTEEEAARLADKWSRRELEDTPSKSKPAVADRRSGTARTYEELTKWYPTDIIDIASNTTMGSKNLETLRRHCRRYVSELNKQAPPELRQQVLGRFIL